MLTAPMAAGEPGHLDLSRIAQDLQIRKVQVEAVVALLDEGNTIPFITRYRKERTGGLDEEVLRIIQERVGLLRHLAERKQTILRTIANQGRLTDDLRAAILAADNPKRLEDLYLPFKPKKRTAATIAREKGLADLAVAIWCRDPALANLNEFLTTMVNPEKELNTPEDVLLGAQHILAEMIAETADVRGGVRNVLWDTGRLCTTKSEKLAEGQGLDYKDYFKFEEPIRHIPPHRILAINRGEKENALVVKLVWDDQTGHRVALERLPMHLPETTPPPAPVSAAPPPVASAEPIAAPAPEGANHAVAASAVATAPPPPLPDPAVPAAPPAPPPLSPRELRERRAEALRTHPHAEFLIKVTADALNRLLVPSLEREIRRELTQRSESHAVEVFARNLRSKLLAPPLRGQRVLAIDPGFRTGCKLAVLDENGILQEHGVIFPHPPQNKKNDARFRLEELVRKHQVNVIAIGNGTACRETEELVSEMIAALDARRTGVPLPEAASPAPAPAAPPSAEPASTPPAVPEPTQGAPPPAPAPEPSPPPAAPTPEPAQPAMAAPAAPEPAPTVPVTPASPAQSPSSSVAPSSPEASASSAPQPAPVTTPTPDVAVAASEAPAAQADPAPVAVPESAAPAPAPAPPAPPPPPPPPPGPTHAEILAKLPDARQELAYVIVNEAGASVYSTSAEGREEFPDYDATLRGTISIGRRLQDPLSELVKIEPQHVGVGLYQHDVNSKQLKESLDGVVESCVNTVGVDLNTASVPLLRHVSGLNSMVARDLIAFRQNNGPFKDRQQLMQVPGIGEQRFIQAAGFLKILGGDNPLDVTWIHPESYPATSQLLGDLGFGPESLRDKAKLEELRNKLKGLSPEEVATRLHLGVPTVRDIFEALARPGRDPREDLPPPIFKKGVLKLEDLQPNMELKGAVLNVVDFGAFVDIGLKDSGLVHISQMANRYVKSPYDVVAVGDVVNVWVLSVDKDRRRVSLTMIQPGTERKPPERRPQGPPRREGAPPGQRREGQPAAQGREEQGGRPAGGGRPGGQRREGAPAGQQQRRDGGGPGQRREGGQGGQRREGGPGQSQGGGRPQGRRLPPRGQTAMGMNQRGNRPGGQHQQQGTAGPQTEGSTGQTEQGQEPAGQQQGPQRKKKQTSRPNLTQAALAGAAPLSTFGELAAFWEAKKKEGVEPPVPPTPPPPPAQESQSPPAEPGPA